MEKAITSKLIHPERMTNFVLREIMSLELPIERYSNNYHAWSYRWWLVNHLFLHEVLMPNAEKEIILQAELSSTYRWMQTHVSDFSGMHYRHTILMLSIGEKYSNYQTVLEEELSENEGRLAKYFGHESLWHYRRNILYALGLQIINESCEHPGVPDQIELSNWTLSVKLQEQKLVAHINSHLKESSKSFNNSYDEIRGLNEKLATRHLEWLEIHFNNILKRHCEKLSK